MAEKQQLQSPSGMAGLVRYYEEDKAKIKMQPMHVVAICLTLAAFELIVTVLI
ncbi:MAG TPA: preprotein translocase subunit Sec61beta [archaeon]|nr:preprotein translocase subunit Sec61beta [archaeon]